jgi:pSer/pThr/pTyr-binding forkhead associated (FHA) protein
MEADGSAWIRDESSTNGTYVDGRKLRPGEAAPLTAASTVRLAADVPIEVRVIDEGSTG